MKKEYSTPVTEATPVNVGNCIMTSEMSTSSLDMTYRNESNSFDWDY